MRGEGPPHPCPWTEVAAAATSQSLIPALYYALRPFASSLPDRLRADLLLEFRKAQVLKWYAFERLGRVVQALRDARVEFAVLKGAAAAAHYPDLTLRPFGDIDLLVRTEIVDKAEAALRSLGYLPSRPSGWARQQYFHSSPLLPQEVGCNIDLHWALTRPQDKLPMPTALLWERLTEVEVQGVRLPVLDPVDQLLYLTRHAFVQHRFALGLRPVLDISHLIASWGEREWAALAARVRSEGWRACLQLALGLVERILAPGAVPEEVRIWLWSAQKGPFDLQWAEEMLWRMPGASVPVTIVNAWVGRKWVARGCRLLSVVFPPPQAMAAIYKVFSPGPRLWLTYLWRPFDLLRRRGLTLLQLFTGKRDMRLLWNQQIEIERWLQALDS